MNIFFYVYSYISAYVHIPLIFSGYVHINFYGHISFYEYFLNWSVVLANIRQFGCAVNDVHNNLNYMINGLFPWQQISEMGRLIYL